MTSGNQTDMKKELIKIIKSSKIEEVIYEPRYRTGYALQQVLLGATITIRTTIK